MSFKIVDEVLEEPLLTPPDKLILVALGKHAKDSTRIAWPSKDRLRILTGLSESTIHRRLRYLERVKILVDVGDERGGRTNSTQYYIETAENISKILVKNFKQPKNKPCHHDTVCATDAF